MVIGNAINFDNTLLVHTEAMQNANRILNNKECGNETQSYQIGSHISGNGLGFNTGTIIDTYSQNGYWYYVVKYKLKPHARKTYTKTLRQKDIKLI